MAKTDTLKFAAAFSADMKPRRIPVDIDGHEGFVSVRKMAWGPRSQFNTLGLKFNAQGAVAEIDGERRSRFLIAHTLVDWLLWTKQGEEWQQVIPPEGNAKARELWLETNLDLDADFGEALVDLCMDVNGLKDDQAKNSPPSSDS